MRHMRIISSFKRAATRQLQQNCYYCRASHHTNPKVSKFIDSLTKQWVSLIFKKIDICSSSY